jgi:ABC-type transport system involved in multi-copper enzyme maturation permease subunit
MSQTHLTAPLTPLPAGGPSAWRAWLFLIRHSWQRQARARLMVWIALGLLLFLTIWVALITKRGVWDVRNWRQPRRGGLSYAEWIFYYRFAPPNVLSYKRPTDVFKPPPRHSDTWAALYRMWTPPHTRDVLPTPPPPAVLTADPVQLAVAGALDAVLQSEEFRLRVAFVSFTQNIIFSIFATFLLPLCSLSFATEALGREREQGNLLWTLTRPLPRGAIYLAKFIAVLPWCLALNVGGFYLVCRVAGPPGQLAFATFWPAIVLGTLAFAALFHLMGALFRRAPVIAILYSFFLETVMGNLPGHLKRASISFYMRCLMYDSASEFNLRPDRPLIYNAVSGPAALGVLVGVTVVLLAVGMWVFTRSEYLDIS